MNRFIKVIVILALMFISFTPQALAEENEESLKLEKKKMGVYKNDNPTYAVETLNYKDVKDIKDKEEEDKEKKKNGFEAVGAALGGAINFVPNALGDAKDETATAIKDQGLYMMSMMSNGLMSWNVFMTDMTLNFFSYSNDAKLLNYLIDGVEETIESVAGVNDGGFTGTGIFGEFLGLVLVLVLFGVIYNAFFKRAPVQAFEGLATPIICMVLAMALISNMGTVLKGINSITNTTMNNVITFGTGLESDADINSIEDVLHKAMVYTPYVNMMFGTDDDSIVEQQRVKDLMTTKKASERKKLLKEEYKNGNKMVDPDSVSIQILYGVIATFCNSILGLSILVVSLTFLVLQIFLILIAFLSPFALIWACLPGQFAVAKQYIQTLLTPFLYKLGLAILVMVLGMIVTRVSMIEVVDGIVGYGLKMLLIFSSFVTMFILRKKIMAIFSVTPEGRMLNSMMNAQNNIPNTLMNATGYNNPGNAGLRIAGNLIASKMSDSFNSFNPEMDYEGSSKNGNGGRDMYSMSDFTNDSKESDNTNRDYQSVNDYTGNGKSETENDFNEKNDSSVDNEEFEKLSDYTGDDKSKTENDFNEKDDSSINNEEFEKLSDYTGDKGTLEDDTSIENDSGYESMEDYNSEPHVDPMQFKEYDNTGVLNKADKELETLENYSNDPGKVNFDSSNNESPNRNYNNNFESLENYLPNEKTSNYETPNIEEHHQDYYEDTEIEIEDENKATREDLRDQEDIQNDGK